MLTSALHRWHVNLVLFYFDGGQVPHACLGLKVHVLNKMLWPFATSARTRSKPFLAKPKF